MATMPTITVTIEMTIAMMGWLTKNRDIVVYLFSCFIAALHSNPPSSPFFKRGTSSSSPPLQRGAREIFGLRVNLRRCCHGLTVDHQTGAHFLNSLRGNSLARLQSLVNDPIG